MKVDSTVQVARAKAQPSTQHLLSLARSRVFKRLERAVDYPLLIAAAPTGYGKSTVLREYLNASGRPYRCLQLSQNHGDLLGFMRAFAATLSDLAPALSTSFMSVYDRVHTVEDPSKPIAEWAAGQLLSVDTTIVIDGLEHLTDDRLFALLTELVDQTASARLSWILVTQSADRFPVARWLANDRMDMPLEDVDFALTVDDLMAGVEGVAGDISRSALRALARAAENWPAAIAVALDDIAGLPALLSATGSHPYSYFAKHAFAARAHQERRFLLETCLYGHFDLALLKAAGWTDVEPMLAALNAAGAILYQTGEGEYRYHEIFRSFLESRLRASLPGVFERVNVVTANICRQVGRWSDALELYANALEPMPLAELLSEHGFELIDRGETDRVSRGIAALGDGEYAAYPIALAVKASVESLHGSVDTAEAWFRLAIKNVADPRGRASIVFRFATDLVRQDRRDAIELLEPIVAEGDHDLPLAVSLAGLLATAYATHQQIEPAKATIERALEQLPNVADQTVRAKLFFQAGYVAFFARDPDRAKAYARAAVDTALTSHLYDIAARALSILYNVAIDHDDDVRSGRHYLDQLASCSIKAGSRHLLLYAVLAQFELEVTSGNLAESARLDEELKTLEVEYSVTASEVLLPAQALRATWSGDFHRAYRLVAMTAEKQITPQRRSQRYAEIALYAAAAGLHAEASAALRATFAGSVLEDAGDKSVILTQAYVTLALILLGRPRRAARLLRRIAQSAGRTPRLERLLAAITAVMDRWTTGKYDSDLQDALAQLDACELGGLSRMIEALPLPEAFRGQFIDLTPTEREVLIHLSAGMNVTEIASLSTRPTEAVEALIRSMCRKLGCTNPRHAVALALNAGMLRGTAGRER